MLSPQPTSIHPISQNRDPNSTTTTCSNPNLNFTNGKASLRFNKKREQDSSHLVSEIRQKAREKKPWKALNLFRSMVFSDLSKHCHTYPISTVLGCCASLRAVQSGKEVHGFMIRHSSHGMRTLPAESALVDFYSKCGEFSAAQEVFDRMPVRDVVTWTIILTAYADRDGYEHHMMSLFIKMLHDCIDPNSYTITVLLHGITLQQGQQLHAYVVKNGWHSDTIVGSSLLDMYARNGKFNAARLALDQIKLKDVISYNSLLSCLGRVGSLVDQIKIFIEICKLGFDPTQSTLVSLLNGCANSGFIGPSKQLHGQGIKRGFGLDEIVQGVIVDMYAKCGELKSARAVFNQIRSTKNVVIWNAMIGGYGKHGCIKEALNIFSLMQRSMVRPNHITFICLLSACSHAGWVDKGWSLFNEMQQVYNIYPRNEHNCCMVDLLGRAGMVREAYQFICRYKCEYRPSVWGALLSACRVWGDTDIGEIASRRLFELEPDNSGSYVAMASIYAASGRWGESNGVRDVMDSHNIRKDTGYSWIEIEGEVCKFRAGERSSDATWLDDVYSVCQSLNESISHTCLIDCFLDWEAQIS
jgi:pentatricopeptide repeat protein